ncbi:putative glycoside hydrolase family 13 protein [Phaeoacremonium minimum UCRPA7]|uniref:Putative glycoside hydrolase family 13 protein n=1 Tax=Phaeoacremonium minimum (strain UCR-PA7) TaxID=1286976 RepID=R8BM83_PHAM7|nr:putative glycoside hydrolase family 13 protein [Phaeoacremonium minimum UCRPA7]EOO00442.1 putative glycoside hydrolase family 13 protein [Phaeoacremonium minimum UCRPA7]
MVAVTFNEFVTTLYGQTIKIVGDIDALGNWNPDQGIVLSASEYTPNNPLWSVTVNLQPGQVIEYKYINVAADSTITWEGDPNHTFTAPASCATAITNPLKGGLHAYIQAFTKLRLYPGLSQNVRFELALDIAVLK